MKTNFITCFIVLSFTCLAQTSKQKGLDQISRKNAEAYISFLADDELEGREAGTHGSRIAAHYIVSCLKTIGIEPLGESYYHPFDAYNRERQQRTRFQVHPDSIKLFREGIHQRISMNNILGKIEGKNKHEYVIIGAHYDHLGMDINLEGDKIYNGADDNASGVSAVLQIANAFMVSSEQPERTIIFAFWDGEEKGLLGSQYFTMNFPSIQQVKAYLNFDMIGRNSDEANPQQVDYFYTASHPAFEKWLKEDIQTYHLPLQPIYHAWDNPVGGSDNGSFARKGIPIIWYHTNGHPDYHMPGDHTEKINWEKLEAITKAAFLNMWNLANETNF